MNRFCWLLNQRESEYKVFAWKARKQHPFQLFFGISLSIRSLFLQVSWHFGVAAKNHEKQPQSANKALWREIWHRSLTLRSSLLSRQKLNAKSQSSCCISWLISSAKHNDCFAAVCHACLGWAVWSFIILSVLRYSETTADFNLLKNSTCKLSDFLSNHLLLYCNTDAYLFTQSFLELRETLHVFSCLPRTGQPPPELLWVVWPDSQLP